MNYCKIRGIPTVKKVAEPVELLPDRQTVTAFIESLKDAEPARVHGETPEYAQTRET